MPHDFRFEPGARDKEGQAERDKREAPSCGFVHAQTAMKPIEAPHLPMTPRR